MPDPRAQLAALAAREQQLVAEIAERNSVLQAVRAQKAQLMSAVDPVKPMATPVDDFTRIMETATAGPKQPAQPAEQRIKETTRKPGAKSSPIGP